MTSGRTLGCRAGIAAKPPSDAPEEQQEERNQEQLRQVLQQQEPDVLRNGNQPRGVRAHRQFLPPRPYFLESGCSSPRYVTVSLNSMRTSNTIVW